MSWKRCLAAAGVALFGLAATIYGVAGAGGGLVLGSVVGLCIRTDRWSPVQRR